MRRNHNGMDGYIDPVSARYAGGDNWESPGIAWSDFKRMGTQVRKQSNERRMPTPDWVLDNNRFREIVVMFLEDRAGIEDPHGSLWERLKRAGDVQKAKRPILIKRLTTMCREYVEKKAGEADAKDLRSLEMEIEALDTYLRYTEKDGGAATMTAVAYLYHLACFDSVGVSEVLGLKPPHVRQILWRMNQLAKKAAA